MASSKHQFESDRTTAPRITARLFGGLGNQLFIYATARQLTAGSRADLYVDTTSGFAFDTVYQRIPLLSNFRTIGKTAPSVDCFNGPLGRFRRFWARTLSGYQPASKRYYWTDRSGFQADLLGHRVYRSIYLDGYWQDSRYFSDVSYELTRELQLATQLPTAADVLANRIAETDSIGVHLRTYQDVPGRDRLAIYAVVVDVQHRLAALLRARPSAKAFVFSDSPQIAREAFGRMARTEVVDNRESQGNETAPVDIWLLSRCRHFILSKSTFSWWGAWISSPSARSALTRSPAEQTIVCR